MTQGGQVNYVNEWNTEYPFPRWNDNGPRGYRRTPIAGGDRDSRTTDPSVGAYGRDGGSNVKVVDGKSSVTASPLTPTQWKITQVIDEIEKLLIDKNNAYGNSFADPIGVFSKADALAQLDVRIDDKLNRIKKGSEYQGDDTELDLIGYLILKRVLRAL